MIRTTVALRAAVAASVLAVVAGGAGQAAAAGRPATHRSVASHRLGAWAGVHAAATRAGTPGTATGMLVVLPLRLSALAQATITRLSGTAAVTPAERGARGPEVLALSPARAEAPPVESWARAHRLTVDQVGEFDVTLSGSAASMAAAFGTGFRTATARLAGRSVSYLVPTRSTGVPAAISAEVSSVVGLDQRPVQMWADSFSPPAGGYGGTAFHGAYDLPRTAAEGGGIDVGTLQLSGWNQTDLDTYAADHGIPFLNQIQPVEVDGATDTHESQGTGNVEVDLDQETILADAPAAVQRIFFAPLAHTSSGYYATNGDVLAAFDEMADYAAKGLVQVASDSWGGCEHDTGKTFARQITSAVKRIVAAGATFFAATGDTGKYGCARDGIASHRTLVSVGFPASVPAAVAVGGTTLLENHHAHESYEEKAWDDGSLAAGGSNGGVSTLFAKPSYQRHFAGRRRLVPDISAVADERTPFRGIFDCKGSGNSTRCVQEGVGGTSLATPLCASMLADVEAAAGVTKGVGDIHSALYKAPQSDFRDITRGGGHITFPAKKGYDEVTGRGSPLWSKLAPRLGLTPRPGQYYHPVGPSTLLAGRTMGANTTTTVAVAGHAGVSAAASSMVLDVTVADATAATEVSVYPYGTTDRAFNDADGAPGLPGSTQLTVKLGRSGEIDLWNHAGTAQVSVTVEGYYSSGAGYRYHPLTPTGPIGGSVIDPGDAATVDVTGAPASSVALLNVSAASAAGAATVSVSVSTGTRTTAQDAVVLAGAGGDAENLVAVPVSSTGTVTFTVTGSAVTVTAGLEGYYTAGSGDLFYPQNPQPVTGGGPGSDAPQPFVTAVDGQPMRAEVFAVQGSASTATVVRLYPLGTSPTQDSVLTLRAGAPATNTAVVATGSHEGFVVASSQSGAKILLTADGYFR